MFVKLLFLSLVHGVTEFLPVSSSGHVAFFTYLFNMNHAELFLFTIVVHAGTAFSAIYYFRDDIFYIVVGLYKFVCQKHDAQTVESCRWVGMVAMVSFPTAVVGILFRSYIAGLNENPLYIAVGLFGTSMILLSTKFFHPKGLDINSFSYWQAFLVGVAQSCATLPGISRSGSTIAMALFFGATPIFSGKLSYLSSFVVIFGALLLEVIDYVKLGTYLFPPLYLISGFIVSFIVGFFALGLLMRILKYGRLYLFSGYCLFMSVVVIILYLIK